jgi:NADPH:quinone reductase-like Zn-dependent oxidoreductase
VITAALRPLRQERGPGLTCMRAVQITRFGGPEVLEIVDNSEPEAGPGHKLYDISTAGVNNADTHHSTS